jgi:hypothetical protein
LGRKHVDSESEHTYSVGDKVILLGTDGLYVETSRYYQSGMLIPSGSHGIVCRVLDGGDALEVAFRIERLSNNAPEVIPVLLLAQKVAPA